MRGAQALKGRVNKNKRIIPADAGSTERVRGQHLER